MPTNNVYKIYDTVKLLEAREGALLENLCLPEQLLQEISGIRHAIQRDI
jgi:hypothetical protein